MDLREGRLENIFRTVSTSISEQDPGDRRIACYGHDRLFSRTDKIGKIGHFCGRQSGCRGTVGCQASRRICDDDVDSGESEDIPG